MKKLLILSAALLLAACDYQPWSSSSSEEPKEEYDLSSLDFKDVNLENKLYGSNKETFMDVSMRLTKKVKVVESVGMFDVNDIDDGKLYHTDIELTATNTFYANDVHQARLEATNEENLYTSEINFIRDGYAYDYEYSCEYGDIDEDCYKKTTDKTDLWEVFELPIIMIVGNVFEEDSFEIGTYESGKVGVANEAYESGDYKVNGTSTEMRKREQAIIYFETYDNYYRVSAIDYIYHREVKYDFNKMKVSNTFHTYDLEKFHCEFDYATDVGVYDEGHLKRIMEIAE